MRVGFDVSPLAGGAPEGPWPRGVQQAVRGAVEALERRGNLEVVRIAAPSGTPRRRWLARDVGRLAREGGLRGVHSFVSSFARRGPGRRVQTIHELPWRHGVAENAGPRHRLWAALGPLFADRVVTATEYTANDLRRRRLPGANKIRVCPWGVGPPFEDEPPPGAVDEVVLGRYRLPEDPLLLCLGAVRAKKNLAAVLAGVAAVRERGGPKFQVVVTGGDTPDLRRDLGTASALGLSSSLSTLDEVTDEDLPGLLRLATAVCVLSRSEGFGLPVLEALACGTPVVVPHESAQTEVAGPLGIRVDPDDARSVADGLTRAHDEREALRYRLAERARELSWDACAERIEAVWSELA